MPDPFNYTKEEADAVFAKADKTLVRILDKWTRDDRVGQLMALSLMGPQFLKHLPENEAVELIQDITHVFCLSASNVMRAKDEAAKLKPEQN